MNRPLVLVAVLTLVAVGMLTSPPVAVAAPLAVSAGDASSSYLADCTIMGTEGADQLTGTSGDDFICGLGGDDVIRGLGGDDTIYGGPGDDREFGGRGDDQIVGQTGVDHLVGGPGDDALFGGGEDDTFAGGAGSDSIEDRTPNTRAGSWYAGVRPYYDLPDGTTVTWTYLANSGRCLDYVQPPITRTVGGEGPWAMQVFLTSSSDLTDRCAYLSSRAWFGIEINTPSGQHRVGQVEVETGTANSLVWQVTTTCLYFGSTHCEGGSDTQPQLIKQPEAPVNIGPIS